jgi:hypothetical protein
VRKESPLVPIGFTVGALALFGGLITGLGAVGQAAALNCPSKQCPPGEWADLDRARAWGNVSTGMFIGAGAGLATGITGLVLTRRVTVQRRGFSVQPWASPAGIGVGGSFK